MKPHAFTLIELLVVITLMTLAVSLVTLRLDGVTAHGRCRAFASQMSSIVRLAQAQARCDGRPRLIETDAARGNVRVRSLELNGGRMRWSAGQIYPAGTGVEVTRILKEGSDREARSYVCRISVDGSFASRLLVLRAGRSWAVLRLTCWSGGELTLLSGEPPARTYETLLEVITDEAASRAFAH